MIPGERNVWPVRLSADRHRDVKEGEIELSEDWLKEIGKPAIIAVRGEMADPVLQLKVKHRGLLTAVLSIGDFNALRLPLPPNEIKVRALTRAEVFGRRAKNAALPAAGAIGVCAGVVGAFVGAPIVAAIGAGAGLPAVAVAIYKSRKE